MCEFAVIVIVITAWSAFVQVIGIGTNLPECNFKQRKMNSNTEEHDGKTQTGGQIDNI